MVISKSPVSRTSAPPKWTAGTPRTGGSRLQTPDLLAALPTVRGAERWRIVEEDHRG